MQEKQIEEILKDGVEEMGGLCLKWVSPSTRGVPDRIVIWPDGWIDFVELKTKRGRLSTLQKHVIKELRKHNVTVHVLKGGESVLKYLDEQKNYLNGHEV